MKHDEKTQMELEAAVFRRLLEHLRKRSDVQNIDMMNLAGFCRNCLSNWFEDAAKERGVSVARATRRSTRMIMPHQLATGHQRPTRRAAEPVFEVVNFS